MLKMLKTKAQRHKAAMRRAAVIKGPTTAWTVLKKVEAIVEAEATVVDMGVFVGNAAGRLASLGFNTKWGKGSICDSVGCIEGWAGTVLGVDGAGYGPFAPVPRLLGLDEDQVQELFFPNDLTMGALARHRVGPREHQRQTLLHLRKFMAENEAQLKARSIPAFEERDK